jgi:hypothetical protein
VGKPLYRLHCLLRLERRLDREDIWLSCQ